MSEAERRVYFIEWLVFALLFTVLVGFLLCRKNVTALVVSLEKTTPVKLVLQRDVTSENVNELVARLKQTPGVIGVDVISSATLQHVMQQQEPWIQQLDAVVPGIYPASINVAIERSLRDRRAFASVLVGIAQLDGVETLMYEEKGFDKSRDFVRFVYQLFRGALAFLFLCVGIVYCATRALGTRAQYSERKEGEGWVEEGPAHFTSGMIVSSIAAGVIGGMCSLAFLWACTETANLVVHYRLVFFTLEENAMILFSAAALRVGLDVLTSRWQRARKLA